MKNSNSNTRIRTLINELNISQTEFCNKTGITKSALSNYLNGDRQPRQDQLDKIAKAFNINPSWLMGYDVPMSSDRDIYMEMVVKKEQEKNLHFVASHITKYAELMKAAEGCTDEQIHVVINTLKAFKKSDKEEKP